MSDRNIDEELVRSIALPAQDPNAAEVFYRIITGGWVVMVMARVCACGVCVCTCVLHGVITGG